MRHWISAAAVFIAVSASTLPVQASFNDAVKAFAQKEYQAAMKLFRPLAEKGNAIAQYRIALMHKMGWGVPKSQKEAKKWSRLAAKQGNPDAQIMLAQMYYTGDSDESAEVSRAYMWYETAAAGGSVEAQKERDAIAKNISPEQIASAKQKAQTCRSSNYAQCD